MKLFTAAQIRDWDQFTILNEPVSSLDLMERAATACSDWLDEKFPDAPGFSIWCGKGNNGGDGLAIARLLSEKGFPVIVSILEFGHPGTDDFQQNLSRLHAYPEVSIQFIQQVESLHSIPGDYILVDALFGSGLNRTPEGLAAAMISHLNNAGNTIVAIDLPSGLFTDTVTEGLTIQAGYTLSFQCYKTAFLLPESEKACGQVEILDIGLHTGFINQTSSTFELTDDQVAHHLYKPRNPHAHKGIFGHALLIAGSRGKMGAAVLAAKACLRSGAGLLTTVIPGHGNTIIQTALPEAMTIQDPDDDRLTTLPDLYSYSAIGIGPGIGQDESTAAMLETLLRNTRKPLVLDADALNILSAHADWISLIPEGSVLTPHPKEFERLAGKTTNSLARFEKALELAVTRKIVIIVKGHHSFIATPGGKGWFNSTGNPGMATAGSGDVLTGIITGLMAQGYTAEEAAVLGCWLHGKAGDLAAAATGQDAMIARDIIEQLGRAFITVY